MPTITTINEPVGRLKIIQTDVDPLSYLNIESIDEALIKKLFPNRGTKSTIPFSLGSDLKLIWVFRNIFNSLSDSEQNNYITKWNFPFYRYFYSQSNSGKAFVEISNPLDPKYKPVSSSSGGNGSNQFLFGDLLIPIDNNIFEELGAISFQFLENENQGQLFDIINGQ
jgi:hypothetical protein